MQLEKSIGQVIRELRKKEQITQEKLAEVLNVSFQSVSRWENDLAFPDITLIPVIAKYFQVTTDFLFGMNQEEIAKAGNNMNPSINNTEKMAGWTFAKIL